MPEHDLDLLIKAARTAGAIALRFWKRDPMVWEKDAGAGPVTEADYAVNESLHAELRAARPDYGWLSEESPDGPERLSAEAVFIIDPIDGTRAFVEGDAHFAVSIAVARAGAVVAAVVYLPALDKLYAAHSEGPSTCNGQIIGLKAECPDLPQAEILTSKANLAPHLWPHGLPVFKRVFRSSIAYRLSLVAEGRFDGMLTFQPSWEWDIAAGALIAQRAGAVVCDQTGAPVQFNRADPRSDGLLAMAAPLLDKVLAARSA